MILLNFSLKHRLYRGSGYWRVGFFAHLHVADHIGL